MKTLKKNTIGADGAEMLGDAEMKKLTGFRNWPPTKQDLAEAEAKTAARLASLDQAITTDPGRQAFVEQVRAEAEIAVQLHKLRLRAKKTQAEIAAIIGTTQSAVARIEHGKNLRMDTICKYAAACGQRIRIKLVAAPLSPSPTKYPILPSAALAVHEESATYQPKKSKIKRSQPQ